MTEYVMICLDVGSSMSVPGPGGVSPLSTACKAVSMMLQQKMLFNKKDQVGLVLFGTKETSNTLAQSLGGYEHVFVARDVVSPDVEFVKYVDELKGADVAPDYIDGFVVALHTLLQAASGASRIKLRLFLITDGAHAAKSTEDLSQIVDKLKEDGVQLEVIGVDFTDEPHDDDDADERAARAAELARKSPVKVHNERILYKLAADVGGNVWALDEALEMLSVFNKRTVRAVTKFRGPIEIGPDLSIPVWMYTRTSEVKFPSLKKVSTVGEEAGGDGRVTMDRSYVNVNDPDRDLDKDDTVKAYKYGKQMVPFSAVDEEALKYTALKCCKVLGFVSADRVPRAHLMEGVDILAPEPRNPLAATALSALINALAEMKQVALVRMIKRKGGKPKLGVLWPEITAAHELLNYCALPFADDLRDYVFTSLQAHPAHVPSKAQLQAARQLVDSLDLMQAARNDDDEPTEALQPQQLFNPAIQRFYQCVQSRALDPKLPLPQLDPLLRKHLELPETLRARVLPALQAMREQFPLKRVEKKAAAKRKAFTVGAQIKVSLSAYDKNGKRAKTGGDAAGSGSGSGSGADKPILLADTVKDAVLHVGGVDPLGDFQSMLRRRDVDLVDRAIAEMGEVVGTMVRQSVKDQMYGKALGCIEALRVGCVTEEEGAAYNTFLRKLKSECAGGVRDDFWQRVAARGAATTLISAEESSDVQVTAAERQAFFATAAAAPAVAAPALDDDDDLMDELE